MKPLTLLSGVAFCLIWSLEINGKIQNNKNQPYRLLYGPTYPIQKAIETVPILIQSLITKPTITSNNAQKITIRHTPNNELCEQEKIFIQKRLEKITHAYKTLRITTPPRIAICLSGGGLRALFCSLGFLQGLSDAGILQTTSYVSCLSGSTWTIAPWIAQGNSLHEYENFLKYRFTNGLSSFATQVAKPLLQTFISNALQGPSCNGADIFGYLLAQALLPTSKTTINFSQAHETLSAQTHPFPIYTAISTNIRPYEWIEITPYEIGSYSRKIYAPILASNSKFENGICLQLTKEKTLSFFLGLFGSAFCVNSHDILEHTAPQLITLKESLPHIIRRTAALALWILLGKPWHQNRLLPGTIPNFMYKFGAHALSTETELTLVDAGIECNLPLLPLFHPNRTIDLIITYDVSAGIQGTELKKALHQAEKNGYISLQKKRTPANDLSHYQLKLSNGHTTNLLYIPWEQTDISMIPQGYTSTTNFTYLPDQISTLCTLGRSTAQAHAKTIWNSIEECLKREDPHRPT